MVETRHWWRHKLPLVSTRVPRALELGEASLGVECDSEIGQPMTPTVACAAAACHAGAVERVQGCRRNEPIKSWTRKKGSGMSLKRGRALGRHANPCRRHFHRSIRSLSPPAEGCLAAEKDGLADSTAPLHPSRCLSQPLAWYREPDTRAHSRAASLILCRV